jgi:hypothetical protein
LKKTYNKNLTPLELKTSEPIIPERLPKETPPLDFPKMPDVRIR